MKKVCRLFLFIAIILGLSACSTKQNYVGTWETDLFDSANTLGTSKEIAKETAGGMFGSMGETLVGMFSEFISYNISMEIREDGTVVVDSGEIFYATWYQDGDKIIIDGDNIYGTATLSSDQKTLYFENTDGTTENTTGLVLGGSLNFVFTKVE